MSNRGTLVWHAFVEGKWAITKPMFQTIQQILSHRRAGVIAADSEIETAKAQREARQQAAAARREMAASGNIYVVPVAGIITQRASLMTEYSGGCSVEDVVNEVREAMAMPSVSAVLLDFDSPGGSVYGVPEAFDALKALRGGSKPLVALCDPIAASAAYWLASACDAIYCIPSGEAGSVGVYMSHTDYSGMNAQIGIDVSYIYAGQYKVEGNCDEPLSTDGKAWYQKQVDATYQEFIADVAEGRGVTAEVVMAQFGEGRCLMADDAKAAGMIDDILTFDQVIQKLSGPATGRKGKRGTGDGPARVAGSHPTGMGSRQDDQYCTTCSEACTCDLEDCPEDCPDCDPGCPCRIAAESETDDDTSATAALRETLAARALSMDMERRR